MTKQEEKIAKAYATSQGVSLGEAFKQALFDRIEDEIDVRAADEAYAEYLKNPVSYSLEDIMKDEGL